MSAPSHVFGYPDSDTRGNLRDAHGNVLGTTRVVAKWRMPMNCFTGTHMYQIEANMNGYIYTGRGFGAGMYYRGKLKSKQPKHKSV